jgi:hypothetical protein
MAIGAIVPYPYMIMSIHNTKKPLYHIWHVDAEDSPLGMMMENTEEGAHVTLSHAWENCTSQKPVKLWLWLTSQSS